MTAQQDNIIREMTIRTFNMNDFDAVVDIWLECKLFNGLGRDAAENELKVAQSLPTGKILLGELDGKIIASVFVVNSGMSGWIWDLAVLSEYRNLGYGRDMVFHAEKWAKEQGIRQMMLFISPDNTEVISFYEKSYYKKMDQIVMSRDLYK